MALEIPIAIPTNTIIHPSSSNEDVRQFLADLLQHIDSKIMNDKAWEMAFRFAGGGSDALELKREGWDKLFGESHGGLVFKRFCWFRIMDVSRNTYVDVSFNLSTLTRFTRIEYIGFSSYFFSLIQGGLSSIKIHSRSTEAGTSQLLSTSSAMDSPTTSPPQNRSTTILPGPNTSKSDSWDQHRKAGYQPSGMEVEQNNDQESRHRRPFYQDMY